jgi:DNA-binding GntR family transcriptional regulator
VGHPSSAELLTLHAVRVTGMTDAFAIARRTGLARELVEDLLLDDEARGWVQRVAFADLAGWSLTETGRLEGERRLADELEGTGARPAVARAHDTFTRLNERFLLTLTHWQIRPQAWDRLAANDHDDPVWDGRVLDELASYRRRLGPLCAELTAALERFAGYDERYAAALARAEAGQARWVDGVEVDSCHTVWIQLHEDLLATLGIDRSTLG